MYVGVAVPQPPVVRHLFSPRLPTPSHLPPALDSLAQQYMKLPAWAKYNVTLDHNCVPVYNTFSDNTYCQATGGFMDATAADVKSWLSTSVNNVKQCNAQQ